MSFIDYYAVLGVSSASEAVVIKAAFKALMLKYHPDTNRSHDAAERAQAINAAYAVLGDPERRASYDRQREAYAASRARPDNSGWEPSPRSNPEWPAPPRSTREQNSSRRRAVVDDDNEEFASSNKLLWLIYASAVLVVATVIAFGSISQNREDGATRDSTAYPSVAETAAETDDGEYSEDLTAQLASAEAPPPIAERDVLDGVDDLAKTFKKDGFVGVIAENERCVAEASQSPSWRTIDRCEAYGAEADKLALSLQTIGGGADPDTFFGSKLSGNSAGLYQLLGKSYSYGMQRSAQIKNVVSRMTPREPITYGDILNQLEVAAKAEASSQRGM